MRVKVCTRCDLILMAKDIKGKDACPVCLNKKFKEVELPAKLRCIYCKRERTIEEILKIWKTPPFFHLSTGTYYDGCRGWD